MAFDFEKNNFTTNNFHDEHHLKPETIFQGGVQLKYVLTKTTKLSLGLQHGSRKKKKEELAYDNNNLWLGIDTVF